MANLPADQAQPDEGPRTHREMTVEILPLPRPIRVTHAGVEVPGQLLATGRNPDGEWFGLVRFHGTMGQHEMWKHSSYLRRTEPSVE